MPNKKTMRHASALKAHRQSLARKAQNYKVRSRLRTLSSNVSKAIAAKNAEGAKKEFIRMQAEWNKAAHKGIFHRNAAARVVSRLASRIAALSKA
jgi:small subunit ribosomal protein S20